MSDTTKGAALLLNEAGNIDRVRTTNGDVYNIESTLAVDAAESAMSAAEIAKAAAKNAIEAEKDRAEAFEAIRAEASGASISVGTVVSGEKASASIKGEPFDWTLDLTLPRGEKGDKGDTGSVDTHVHGMSDIEGLKAQLDQIKALMLDFAEAYGNVTDGRFSGSIDVRAEGFTRGYCKVSGIMYVTAPSSMSVPSGTRVGEIRIGGSYSECELVSMDTGLFKVDVLSISYSPTLTIVPVVLASDWTPGVPTPSVAFECVFR